VLVEFESTLPKETWDWTQEKISVPNVGPFKGQFVQLERLTDSDSHDLWSPVVAGINVKERRMDCMEGLSNLTSVDQRREGMSRAESKQDSIYLAALDTSNGAVTGLYNLRQIDLGHRWALLEWSDWGQQSNTATIESLYLIGRYLFGERNYNRLEWRQNVSDNSVDRRVSDAKLEAMTAFGFMHEGVWRRMGRDGADQHFYSVTRGAESWSLVERVVEKWLRRENFDLYARERSSLKEIRYETTHLFNGQ